MIIRTKSEIQIALDWLQAHDTVSYDIETTGLNTRKDQIIGFGCASPTTLDGFYIVMREYIDGELLTQLNEREVAPVLEALKAKKLITWNGSFDTRFTLCQTGVNLVDSIYCDGMLLAHSCDENRFQYGLKALGSEIFGESVIGDQAAMKESIRANGGSATEYYKANSELMARYGLMDNILTCRLYNHFVPLLAKDGLTKFFFEDEVMPLYREVTIPMELNGIPLDLPLINQTLTEINTKLSEFEDRIQAAIKPLLIHFEDWYIRTKFPFKLSGPFKQALAKRLAPPGWPTTDSGAFSFNAVDLKRAKKNGVIPDEMGQLERYVTSLDRVPEDLIRSIQMELLADEGLKFTFNILSTDHLKRLFFGTSTTPSLLNEEPISKTPTGAGQVDDDFLAAMAKKYQWCADLRIYRSLIKLRGTYIERFLEESEDGLFYPSFAQHRTVSGRYGSDFQQLPRPYEPKDLEEGKVDADTYHFTNLIRRFFIAPEGYTIVDDDYESLEPHIFAHVANDPALINIFNTGLDFYSEIAIKTEKLRDVSAHKKADNYLGKVNKAKRQSAKSYCLGVPYGMSGYKLQFEIEVSQSQAEQLVRDYLNAFPELKAWMARSRLQAFTTGIMKVETGRIRRFPNLVEDYKKYGSVLLDGLELWKQFNETPATYKYLKEVVAPRVKNALNNAMNVQIQGLAASIMNKACIAIARELKARKLDARIVAQVHDENVLFAHESCVEEVKELVQRNMENIYPLRLKLKAVPSTGANLADAKGA